MGDVKRIHSKDHRRNRATQVHIVEVVAPAGLRLVVCKQAVKVARHYVRLSVVDEEAVDGSDQDP